MMITCIRYNLTKKSLNNKGIILLTKITAASNDNALSYHTVRGLHSVAVIFFGDYINIRC